MKRRIRTSLGISILAGFLSVTSLPSAAIPASHPSPSAPSGNETPRVVTGIRHWTGHLYTRVVVDLDGPTTFEQHLLENPNRLVIDLRQATLAAEMTPLPIVNGTIREVQAGNWTTDTVRVVLQLVQMERYKVFQLSNPSRLVVDLFGREGDATAAVPILPPAPATALEGGPSAVAPSLQDFPIQTIVLDAGHGGEDPGAIGKSGLQEKDVVLDVALRLRELLTTRYGKKVIMTRDRDVFIPLEERTAIANSKKADLFLSIHANASPRKEARGIETYLLGRSASREAALTAARENSASERSIGDLEDILSDLMTAIKKEESLRFAHYVQGSLIHRLQPHYPVVDLGVKQAPFYVLVNADMPSILAEISFVTNPDEERRLANPDYRQQIAEALLSGVEKYVAATKLAFQRGE